MTERPKFLANHSLKRQVEAVARKRFASQSVVDLAEFRSFKKEAYQSTILVVDDEDIIRSALKRILESNDYKVITAEDGMGLTKLLDSSHFDLIILDIGLPWVSGIELCAMLKGHSSVKHVPIVLMSGKKAKDDVDKAFAAGCNDFIAKPFEIESILDIVSKSLEKLEDAK